MNWAVCAAAIGGGVVAIGGCYGKSLSKDEGWELAKSFFLAAGGMYIAIQMGTKVFAAILTMTGIGYFGAVALDSAISGAAAYAVGSVAKEYFRRDYLGQARPTKAEMKTIFQSAFKKKKSSV